MSKFPNNPEPKKAQFFVRTLRPVEDIDGIPDFMAAIIRSSSYDIARFIATFSDRASGSVHVKIQETYSTYAPHSEDWEATAPEMLLTGKDAQENEELVKNPGASPEASSQFEFFFDEASFEECNPPEIQRQAKAGLRLRLRNWLRPAF